MSDAPVEFDELSGEEDNDDVHPKHYSDAVVHATDWTTETLVSQLRRGNISLNPRFQRRDAWSIQQKSRFIESLIMGLPVPQIVLAEAPGRRGNYLVLDGKQRLLSLLQFWGLGEGSKNLYALSGLKVLTHLNRKRLDDLEHDSSLSGEFDGLLNQTVRTVVIRNWPDTDFLHMVFLRLNTGSTKLSPQELRQALQPGPFADWVDEQAAASKDLQRLLGLTEPDYRMRDTEVLARFIAFRLYLQEYPGRLKKFIDDTFEKMNGRWDTLLLEGAAALEAEQAEVLESFKRSIEASLAVFGEADVGRRPGSRLVNRTLLDMLLYYAQDQAVAAQMEVHQEAVRDAYLRLFDSTAFVAAIESDTASTTSTVLRLRMWGEALTTAIEMPLKVPAVETTEHGAKIIFPVT